jgi:hypothetical protein
MDPKQEKLKEFVFNIARRYIKTKQDLNVSVKQVVTAIYNDRFLVNLIREKLFPNISDNELNSIISTHKTSNNIANTYQVSSDDNVVQLFINEADQLNLQKPTGANQVASIDTIRILWFNNLEKKHLDLFDIIFGGSPTTDGDLRTIVEITVNQSTIEVPVLFSLQYFLNHPADSSQNINIDSLPFIGNKIGNKNLSLKVSKVELLKKNCLPMNTGNATRFVGPIYIKYIYEKYLFITGAFFDEQQKKSHVFTLKLGNDHIDLNGNQKIKSLIDDTLNEFYKHLGIQISFNLGIDLLEILKYYTAILSKEESTLAELAPFFGYFSGDDGLKSKRFITKVYDLFMEKMFRDITIKSPDNVGSGVALSADETTLLKDHNNQYTYSKACDIYVTVNEKTDLLPLNMKNILTTTFLGYDSEIGSPTISNSKPELPQDNELFRSPIVTTENTGGMNNVATYISPLRLYNGSPKYVIHDKKKSN